MQNKIIAVFLVAVCLGLTTPVLAQKLASRQDQITQLEIENKVRQELIDSLARRIATLETELNAKKQQEAAQREKEEAKKKAQATLKPYYATLEIQQKCEQSKKCAKWAKDIYELTKRHGHSFKITSMKEHRYTQGSGIFHRTVKTIHQVVFYINGVTEDEWGSSLRKATLTRTGLGTDPLSWEDDMYASHYNRQMYYPTACH